VNVGNKKPKKVTVRHKIKENNPISEII